MALYGLPGSPEKNAYMKAWRQANQEKCRATYLTRKYDITLAEYEEMHEAQEGVCAICFEPETGKMLAVDHCHTTGAIRGLLCSHCNTALGKFRDDPARLQSAINYLQEHTQ